MMVVSTGFQNRLKTTIPILKQVKPTKNYSTRFKASAAW
jgi:hypothetical protein